MIILDCVQGSTEWFAAKRGLASSSRGEHIIKPSWEPILMLPDHELDPGFCLASVDLSKNRSLAYPAIKQCDARPRSGDYCSRHKNWPPKDTSYPEVSAKTYQYELARDWIRGYSDDEMAKWEGNDTHFSPAMAHGNRTEPQAIAAYELLTGNKVRRVGVCINGGFAASTDGLVGDDGVLEVKCPDSKTQVRRLVEGVLPAEYRPQVHMEMAVTGRKWVDFFSFCEDWPDFLVRVEWGSYTDQLVENLKRFSEEYAAVLDKLAAKGCVIPERDKCA